MCGEQLILGTASRTSDVLRWCADFRPVPLERLVAELGLRVLVADLGSSLLGATSGRSLIATTRVTPAHRRVVWAHELWHALRGRGTACTGSVDEEMLADRFALELLLPTAAAAEAVALFVVHERPGEVPTLEYDSAADQLARAWDVPLWAVVVRLSGLGSLPPIVDFGDVLVCGRCGWRNHLRDCACATSQARRAPLGEAAEVA